MGLTSEEVDRCKLELGYPGTRIGAEPYITYSAVFDKAITPYLTDTATTSTSVIVAGNASIVLASASGFAVGSKIVVDVGPLQEFSDVLVLSGNTITAAVVLAHGTLGPYPVKLKGVEWFVRDILNRIDAIVAKINTIAPTTAGVEAVNKIRISRSEKGRRASKNMFEALAFQRADARDELARALGLPNLRRADQAGSGLALY